MNFIEGAKISYPEALAAIGRFVAQKGLSDVCVLEFENGVIVTGALLYEVHEGYQRRIETHIFSEQDLRRMIKGH